MQNVRLTEMRDRVTFGIGPIDVMHSVRLSIEMESQTLGVGHDGQRFPA